MARYKFTRYVVYIYIHTPIFFFHPHTWFYFTTDGFLIIGFDWMTQFQQNLGIDMNDPSTIYDSNMTYLTGSSTKWRQKKKKKRAVSIPYLFSLIYCCIIFLVSLRFSFSSFPCSSEISDLLLLFFFFFFCFPYYICYPLLLVFFTILVYLNSLERSNLYFPISVISSYNCEGPRFFFVFCKSIM